MDSAARWFLAGIIVSLVNTALVIAFIGIPGITDDNAHEIQIVTETEVVEVEVPVTYILVIDEDGNVIREEVRVGRPGDTDASPTATPTPSPTPEPDDFTFGAPRFIDVANPLQLAAANGIVLVASGEFKLTAIGLRGGAISVAFDGVENTGQSAAIDVDVVFDGTMFVLLRDSDLNWRIISSKPGNRTWTVVASDLTHRWPASVNAMTASATGKFYLSATDPAGLFELNIGLGTVTPVVEGRVVRGIDAGLIGARVAYAAPAVRAADPPAQIGLFEDRVAAPFVTTYARCLGPVVLPVPGFPPDVALISGDRLLIVDGANHVVRLQERDGSGERIFGRANCTAGSDEASLRSPSAVAVDRDRNVFIADRGNNRLVILPHVEAP